MRDPALRKLERLAATGDVEAVAALARARARSGSEARIELARERFQAGELGEAVSLLLSRWAERPAAELSTVIERLSELADRERVRGRTQGLRVLAWQRRAAKEDPLEPPCLVAALGSLRAGEARELLAQTRGWSRDPRVSAGLLDLCRACPSGWSGRRQAAIWRAVLQEIARHGDPRAREALDPNLDGFYYLPADEVLAVRDALPLAVALDVDESAALDALVHDLDHPPATEADLVPLWAEVYADPDSDAPRAALAAALEQRGDPRGEFIRRQLRREPGSKPSRQETSLLRAHGKDWVGSLLGLGARLSEIGLQRGFPVSAVLRGIPQPGDVKAHDLQTLKRLRVLNEPGARAIESLRALPALPPGLRLAAGASVMLDVLAAGLPCRVVELGGLDAKGLERLGRYANDHLSAVFFTPAIRGAPLGPVELWHFWATPTGRQLEHVWLDEIVFSARIWSWGQVLHAAEAPLRTLRVTFSGYSKTHPIDLIYFRHGADQPWQLRVRHLEPGRLSSWTHPELLFGPVEAVWIEDRPGQPRREAYAEALAQFEGLPPIEVV